MLQGCQLISVHARELLAYHSGERGPPLVFLACNRSAKEPNKHLKEDHFELIDLFSFIVPAYFSVKLDVGNNILCPPRKFRNHLKPPPHNLAGIFHVKRLCQSNMTFVPVRKPREKTKIIVKCFSN